MADADEQCRALTSGGERCTRPAQANGFCYQHDKNDPTIDDETEDTTTDDSSSSTEDDVSDESEEGSDGGDDGSEGGSVGLIEVQDRVRSNAGQLIGHPFDALIEVDRRNSDDGDPEGWLAVVEVVERKAVPDTQDILGRYEVDLSADGTFEAYRRIQRLHRGDTGESDV